MAKNVKQKPKYKAVIFDFDDTLVESRYVKWEQHKVVAKRFYNIDLTDEDIRAHWGKPIWELVSILYKNSDTVENMRNALYSTKQDFEKTVFPDSPVVITKILDSGREVGILSSATSYMVEEDLDRMNFPLDRFLFVLGADDTPVHKPNPGVFEPIHLMVQG